MHSYLLQVEAELEGIAAGDTATSLLQDAGTALSQHHLAQNEAGNEQSSETGVPALSQAASESDALVTADQQRHDHTEL